MRTEYSLARITLVMLLWASGTGGLTNTINETEGSSNMINELTLSGQAVEILVNNDLSLTVLDQDGQRLWESSKTQTPVVLMRTGEAELHSLPLARAAEVSVSEFAEGTYHGQAIRLSGFEGADVAVELVFAIDTAWESSKGQRPVVLVRTRDAEPRRLPLPRAAEVSVSEFVADELLIQAQQVGGTDTIVSIEHLYRFEKPVADGGYMVLPHGSGYLIAADCPDELPGDGPRGGTIGGRWTLPVFGMVRGDQGMCVTVETWWDCDVAADHAPGKYSALDFNWLGSLGELAYPRRMRVRFAEGLDYVAMAKLYRKNAREQGLLRTLEEKAVETPVIRHHIKSILFRWHAWNEKEGPAVLADIRQLRQVGFDVVFFFPKWPPTGHPDASVHGHWPAFLLDDPVPGGWQTLVDLADAVHAMDCPILAFIIHEWGVYDALALERAQKVLDSIEAKGLKVDILYYDGYAAHAMPEVFSPSHPITRRKTFEIQNAVFTETRRRGIMPGGEAAMFWCMADCDYFFADASTQYLSNVPMQGAPAPVGEPVPLFELVFHDCYIAGFAGGGYALITPGYDWWADRTPRLYELLFGCAPWYNLLPEGAVPIDWQSPATAKRLAWLQRWSSFYRATAMSEMVSHQFLSADRKRQRVEFANGVVAEFDMAANQFRVEGVEGFSGDWETPEEL